MDEKKLETIRNLAVEMYGELNNDIDLLVGLRQMRLNKSMRYAVRERQRKIEDLLRPILDCDIY